MIFKVFKSDFIQIIINLFAQVLDKCQAIIYSSGFFMLCHITTKLIITRITRYKKYRSISFHLFIVSERMSPVYIG